MASKVIPNSNFLEDDLGQIPNGSSRPSPRPERYSSRAGVLLQYCPRILSAKIDYIPIPKSTLTIPLPTAPANSRCGRYTLWHDGTLWEACCCWFFWWFFPRNGMYTQGKGSVESRDTPTQAKSSNPKSERTSIPLSPLELRLLSVGIHRSPRLDLGCPSARMKVSVRYAKWSTKTRAIFGI